MNIIILGSIVVGITEVVKRAGGVSSRYIPLVSLLATFTIIAIYCIVSKTAIEWVAIENGFIVALTSVGLYSSVKNTVNK